MRGRRGLGVLLTGVVMGMTLAVPVDASSSVPALGVNDVSMRVQGVTDSRMDELATAAHNLGSTTGVPLTIWRIELAWSDVQPGKSVNPSFQWGLYNRIYQYLRAHQIEPLWIVDRAPPWARDALDLCGTGQNTMCPPGDNFLGYWRNFVKAAVLRYPESAGIDVWNEPNTHAFWGTFVNANRYARVLGSASLGVQDAEQVLQPSMPPGWSVPVILAAPADPPNPSPVWHEMDASDWLNAVYDTGERRFDALGAHVYPLPQNGFPDSGTNPMLPEIGKIAAIRDARGDSQKPIWLTEIGYHTVGDSGIFGTHATPGQQGLNLRCAYGLLVNHPYNVAAFVINGLVDSVANPTDQEGSFGLLRNDLTSKGTPDGYSILQNFFQTIPSQVTSCSG